MIIITSVNSIYLLWVVLWFIYRLKRNIRGKRSMAEWVTSNMNYVKDGLHLRRTIFW